MPSGTRWCRLPTTPGSRTHSTVGRARSPGHGPVPPLAAWRPRTGDACGICSPRPGGASSWPVRRRAEPAGPRRPSQRREGGRCSPTPSPGRAWASRQSRPTRRSSATPASPVPCARTSSCGWGGWGRRSRWRATSAPRYPRWSSIPTGTGRIPAGAPGGSSGPARACSRR